MPVLKLLVNWILVCPSVCPADGSAAGSFLSLSDIPWGVPLWVYSVPPLTETLFHVGLLG